MKEFRSRLFGNLQRARDGMANKLERKTVQENRPSEDASDAILPLDIKKIYDEKQAQTRIEPTSGEIVTAKGVRALLRKIAGNTTNQTIEEQNTRQPNRPASFKVRTVAGKYEIIEKPDDFFE